MILFPVDETTMDVDTVSVASPTKRRHAATDEIRKVAVPSNRYTPLKENWLKLFTPLVEHLHLR